MESVGFIKMHRQMLNWEWYDDINTKVLFLHLLLTVNWEEKKWHGVNIKRGQMITSIYNLSKELRLTAQQVRTGIGHLKSTGEITIESTSQYSIIEIRNYEGYQTNQQENNNQITTTKEDKKIRSKESNIDGYRLLANRGSTDVYPYFLYVFLELGWKPGKSDSVEDLKEWMRNTLKDGGIKSASDAIQTLKEFHKYWECRKDEIGFDKKNWKMTLVNSPSLPINKHKYEARK